MKIIARSSVEEMGKINIIAIKVGGEFLDVLFEIFKSAESIISVETRSW